MLNIKIDKTTKDLIKELKGDKKVSDDFIIWKALIKEKFI